MLKFSDWLYGMFLFVYPMPFRLHFGKTMRQTFRDHYQDVFSQKGKLGLLELWLLTLFDLIISALIEHKQEVFDMPFQKLQRWSGHAIAIGGTTWSFGILNIIYFISPKYNSSVTDTVTMLSSMFFISMPFILWGLIGLYNQLPAEARPFSTIAVAITVIGLFGYTLGWFSMFLGLGPGSVFTLIAGFSSFCLFWGGIFVTGLLTLKYKTHSLLSFVPIAIGTWGFIILLTGITNPSRVFPPIYFAIWCITYGCLWLTLGYAMWQAEASQVKMNRVIIG